MCSLIVLTSQEFCLKLCKSCPTLTSLSLKLISPLMADFSWMVFFFLIIFIFYNFSNLYFLIVIIFATGFYVHLRNILLYVTFSICFGPVFHVTDQLGNKITDSKTIDYIEKVRPCCFFSVLCFSALYQKRPILVAQFHEVPQLNCVAK